MVRVFSLSLLALLAGSAFAGTQEVILDDSVHVMDGWSYVNCGKMSSIRLWSELTSTQVSTPMSFS